MGDFEIKDGVLIKYHGHDQEVVVPIGTIAIGDSAFKDNTSINLVELPSSLCKIDKSAFAGCVNLSSINLPDSLIDIGVEAFSNCKLLIELVFPSKLVSIGERAFMHCESLKKIKLRKSIKFIGFAAFDFTKIKDIFYEGTLAEFGAIKTASIPGCSALFPFSDSSSGSTTIFGMYTPTLHCKDAKDSLYHLLAGLQGLLDEIEQ